MYERTEAVHLDVAEDDRVLELGVGLGYISTLILRSNPKAYLGIEPNPDMMPMIEKVFTLNGVDGEVRNAVVQKTPTFSPADFYVREDFWSSSIEPGGHVKTVKVQQVDIDDLIAEFSPTLIVCDVEGAEAELFADPPDVDRLYVELHDCTLEMDGFTKDQHGNVWTYTRTSGVANQIQ